MNDQLLNIKTCFNLSNSPKSIVITDETDYAGQSINLSDVRGILTMKDPGGNIFYQETDFNSPDIDADVSLSSAEIQLPLDSEGEVKRGNYIVIYTIDVSGTTYVKTFEYDYSFDLPTPVLDFTVNINAATVKSVDNTNYGDFLTSLTRLQTIKYPQSLDPALPDETSSLKTFVVGSPIYTKTWTSVLESQVEFTLADGLCINATLKAVEDLNVTRNSSLCESVDCLKALVVKYESAKCNNPGLAKSLEGKIILASYYYMLAKEYESCGEEEKSIDYCVKIKDIAGSEGCNCGCSDDDLIPEIIYPLYTNAGSGGNIDLQSGGDGIDVSANTVGGITTYTLTLNDGFTESLGSQWLNGNGVPSSGLGNLGDFYIEDDSSLKNYYKKTGSTTWTLQGTLKGADGSSITSGITYDGTNPIGAITFSSTDLNDVIEDLAKAINQNSTDIATNANAINQNSADIATNVSHILTLQADNSSNEGDIISIQEEIDSNTYKQDHVNGIFTNSEGVLDPNSFGIYNLSGLTADLENASGGASYGIDKAGSPIYQDSENLTFVATRDNYVDVDSTGVYQTDVPIGDPAPVISGNRVRVAKVTTDAISITAKEDLRKTDFVKTESIEDLAVTGAKLENHTTARSSTTGSVSISYDEKGRVINIEERVVRVVINPTELSDIHNTPKTLVAGDSFLYVDVINCLVEYLHDTTAYNSSVNIYVKNRNSSTNLYEIPTDVVATAQDQTGLAERIPMTAGDNQYISGDDLVLEADADLGSSGDGYLVLTIKYAFLNDTELADVLP